MSPGKSATIVPASVLAAVPSSLREELLRAFNEVLKNYREGRWEPSELNGGKLCEVVYSILRGHVDGKYPAKASKPRNMVDACRDMEQADAAKFARSVRIQIPRMLIALYEVRNNRGVGHVGGDVDPNHMDATAVVAISKWIVAELVRLFHSVSTDDAQVIVEALTEKSLSIVWKVGELRNWTEYSNPSMFRSIIRDCHKKKLLEYEPASKRVTISPVGIAYVEQLLGKPLTTWPLTPVGGPR